MHRPDTKVETKIVSGLCMLHHNVSAHYPDTSLLHSLVSGIYIAVAILTWVSSD
jgi:hypothetical protein